MSAENVVNIVLCGSLSPITNAHLRSFEDAKDTMALRGVTVKRGILSPVSDAYKKTDLAPASHRLAMCRLATEGSWIQVSSWEADQEGYTPTLYALRAIQKDTDPDIPLYLLGGADLLHSFTVPGVWAEADMKAILEEFGLIVIGREGYDIPSIIANDPLLSAHENRIITQAENVLAQVSSTYIRRAVRAGRSIRYLTPPSVEEYIAKHRIWLPKDDTSNQEAE